MRWRAGIFSLVALAGCTLVVGSDPRVDADAGVIDGALPTDDAAPPEKEDAAPKGDAPADVTGPSDAGTCDAAACNATKNACKTTCANTAKQCNAACTDEDGKSCHDLCNQQLQSCNNGCLVTCLQCVTGCGTCGP